MALDSYIKDPNTGKRATIVEQEGQNCLSVVTQDYKQHLNKSEYFFNPTYGINMNRDFSQIESTEDVHNGNDTILWTGTVIVGNDSRVDFQNTDYAHTGTYSIRCGNMKDGNVFQLANDIIIESNTYDKFSGWVYITQDWGYDSLWIYFYNTTTDEQVSENMVDLSNYISVGNNSVWQKFNIPINDFGLLQDYDAIRFTLDASGNEPDFWLDDLKLEELSEDLATFKIEPPKGTWWYVNGIGTTIVSNYNSTLTDASMPNIPYNGLLGFPLINGIVYQRQEEGEIIYSSVIHNIIDMIAQFNSKITNSGYDGNFTWVKIDNYIFNTPLILKSEFNDFISMNISDDLSGLEMFTSTAEIAEEKRTIRENYDREGLLRVRESM